MSNRIQLERSDHNFLVYDYQGNFYATILWNKINTPEEHWLVDWRDGNEDDRYDDLQSAIASIVARLDQEIFELEQSGEQ